MEGNSRTKKSIINSFYALTSKFIIVILSFAVRTVFIKTLTQQYLGINGLFSNIITMLSLADLGIGIAIPYTLYSPLAKNDTNKIKILMKFYSKIYNVIGIIVLIIGVILIPFLNLFVKEMPDIPNIQLIYFLFVLNSAMSYFFVYKKLLLDSDQKGYIANKIIMKVTIVVNIVQMILLYLTKNYILYLCLNIASVLIQNIIISVKCNKMYPYITENTHEKIKKEDIVELKKNISALCIYKIGVVILNGTDNLIISKVIGVVAVGLYSNYLLITNALTNIISQIFSSITSSVGNMVATDDEQKSENIFKKLQFLNFWIYSISSICLFLLINPFIKIWIGESYCLTGQVAFLIALNFYIYGMQSVVSSFRDAYGLFVQGKYRPIVMVIVNILISIPLAIKIGIPGVIIGTVVSRLFVVGIWDPIVVYKFGFKKSVRNYFVTYYKYLLLYIIISMLLFTVVSSIVINNIFIWILMACIIFVIINIIWLTIYRKTDNFKYFAQKFKQLYKKEI